MCTENHRKTKDNDPARGVVWETLPVVFHLSSSGQRTYQIGDSINDSIANAISHKFHNNSYVSYERLLGNGRPASAYYFLAGGKLEILWGTVGENGEAKLHDFLREDPHYMEMKNNPRAIIRSGHIGTILLPNIKPPIRVALLDKIGKHNLPLNPDCPEYFICTALLEGFPNGILPVTTEGYSVKLATLNANSRR